MSNYTVDFFDAQFACGVYLGYIVDSDVNFKSGLDAWIPFVPLHLQQVNLAVVVLILELVLVYTMSGR